MHVVVPLLAHIVFTYNNALFDARLAWLMYSPLVTTYTQYN